MSIPKRIFTIFLDQKDPLLNSSLIQRCIATHNQPGFEHITITFDNMHHCQYVDECLSPEALCRPTEKKVKASDYLRAWHLFDQGGIYLDADVEVLRPFDDDLLSNRMFVGEEDNGFVSNAVIGAEAGHPILSYYTGMLDRNFKGTGDMVFMPGIQLWSEVVKWGEACHGIDASTRKVYPPEYFMPWNKREMKLTANSYTIHHFASSWCGK